MFEYKKRKHTNRMGLFRGFTRPFPPFLHSFRSNPFPLFSKGGMYSSSPQVVYPLGWPPDFFTPNYLAVKSPTV